MPGRTGEDYLHGLREQRRAVWICGERVGLSFITPHTLQDLERRRVMMTRWAPASCGMMARTIYPCMAETIELLGSSSLMAASAEADFRACASVSAAGRLGAALATGRAFGERACQSSDWRR